MILLPICMGLSGLVVAAVGALLGIAVMGTCTSGHCLLQVEFGMLGEVITTLVAALALNLAWRLRRPSVTRALLVGGQCVAVAAGAVIIGGVWATTRTNLLGGYEYQVAATLPLLLWPPLCVSMLTAVVCIGNESRRLRNAALVTLTVATGYLLTFLAPATDPLSAGLHLHGVLHLPTRGGAVYKLTGGQALSGDDPIDAVNDGYLVTLFPGDYLVTETCLNATGWTSLGPDAHVPVHVSLGATTYVRDACPRG
jgi:hypothetical protein